MRERRKNIFLYDTMHWEKMRFSHAFAHKSYQNATPTQSVLWALQWGGTYTDYNRGMITNSGDVTVLRVTTLSTIATDACSTHSELVKGVGTNTGLCPNKHK